MTTLLKFVSLFWMGVIFYLSSLSGSDVKALPQISDIAGHSLLYLVLGGLLYFSFHRKQALWAVLIASVYGLSDEFHQHFVPGRTPELKDWVVDTLAALTAVLIIKAIRRSKKGTP